MFKVGKLENAKNEVVNIKVVRLVKNKTSIKTLSFVVESDNYTLSFVFNCALDELLKLPMNETINFNNYLFFGESCLNIKGLDEIEPIINIDILRYLKNKFIIDLKFYTEEDEDNYGGLVEFDFNLDDYLEQFY